MDFLFINSLAQYWISKIEKYLAPEMTDILPRKARR
jgi:hypothetical protein